MNSYLDLARLCATKSDFKNAVRAASNASDVYTTCLGADSDKAQDAAKSVRAFEMQVPKN
jgi:hypothetical protein